MPRLIIKATLLCNQRQKAVRRCLADIHPSSSLSRGCFVLLERSHYAMKEEGLTLPARAGVLRAGSVLVKAEERLCEQ
ncbi:hypothetical protein Anapl_11097 [Anas platyrhynchos]|uniref:Uncharacterized protein n=1 Tax=Anas platyrhynchos TaxID=8839 RepID=R0M8N1_ANAPL|nr:hypothetical protein Anapl_11097 [Anas platyrhynchos]